MVRDRQELDLLASVEFGHGMILDRQELDEDLSVDHSDRRVQRILDTIICRSLRMSVVDMVPQALVVASFYVRRCLAEARAINAQLQSFARKRRTSKIATTDAAC